MKRQALIVLAVLAVAVLPTPGVASDYRCLNQNGVDAYTELKTYRTDANGGKWFSYDTRVWQAYAPLQVPLRNGWLHSWVLQGMTAYTGGTFQTDGRVNTNYWIELGITRNDGKVDDMPDDWFGFYWARRIETSSGGLYEEAHIPQTANVKVGAYGEWHRYQIRWNSRYTRYDIMIDGYIMVASYRNAMRMALMRTAIEAEHCRTTVEDADPWKSRIGGTAQEGWYWHEATGTVHNDRPPLSSYSVDHPPAHHQWRYSGEVRYGACLNLGINDWCDDVGISPPEPPIEPE